MGITKERKDGRRWAKYVRLVYTTVGGSPNVETVWTGDGKREGKYSVIKPHKQISHPAPTSVIYGSAASTVNRV